MQGYYVFGTAQYAAANAPGIYEGDTTVAIDNNNIGVIIENSTRAGQFKLSLGNDDVGNSIMFYNHPVVLYTPGTNPTNSGIGGTIQLTILYTVTDSNGHPDCANDTFVNSWLLTGNSGTNQAVNFLGTTDAENLVFKVDNQRSGLIQYVDSGNTAFGFQALLVNSGIYNTAIGTNALITNTTGADNTAVGLGAMYYNTTGGGNVAIGVNALNYNTTGTYNTAVGENALTKNGSGTENVAVGIDAMFNNTTGNYNAALGLDALSGNTIGNDNTAVGTSALQNNTSGINNVGIGAFALYYNTTGSDNIGIGAEALDNTLNDDNVGIGYLCMQQNTTGFGNVAIGSNALQSSNSGSSNVAVGLGAIESLTTGSSNTGIGVGALELLASGNNNTAIGGGGIGGFLTSGSDNTIIGAAISGAATLNNSIAIGYGASVNADNTIILGNSSISTLRCNTQTISSLSDIRFKRNVSPETHGLDFIMQLKPITYNLDIKKLNSFTYGDKADSIFNDNVFKDGITAKESILFSGFSAQQVDSAAQSVGYNFAGVVKPQNEHDTYSLSYSDFVVPLVKAVQEQEKAIEELKALVALQSQQMTILMNK